MNPQKTERAQGRIAKANNISEDGMNISQGKMNISDGGAIISENNEIDPLRYEENVYNMGYHTLAGVDECGRGPLFGCVVSAAVVLPRGLIIEGVKDSKKCTPKARDRLYEEIIEKAVAYGIGMVEPETIDRINIKQASRLSMKLAIQNLRDKNGMPVIPDYILIDAESVDMDIPQQGIIKGDMLSHSISAASIIAKVTRDRLCAEWAGSLNLPDEYREVLIQCKGYPTAKHIECLMKYGYTSLHRKSFLKNYLPLREYVSQA